MRQAYSTCMQTLYGAIEGGGTKFLCAVGSGPDDIQAETRIATTDPVQTLAQATAFFAPYGSKLRAVGVCCFGALELRPQAGERYGALLETPKLGWSHFPLRAELARVLRVPIFIDTDVNGAALAEQRWGAGRDADPLIYVTVGTGVGVGAVIHGRPLHGLMHPELGHMRVGRAQGDSFAGICPFHHDCIEGMASAPALRARSGRDPDGLDDADPIWNLEVHYLAALVHTIVLAYSPERVVLGGGVLRRAILWPKLRDAVRTSLAGYVPRPQLQVSGIADFIVPSRLSGRAGLHGGFALAMAMAGVEAATT